MTNDHISLLNTITKSYHTFTTFSATKKKAVMDMIQHGLVELKADEVKITEKGKNFLVNIEIQAKEFLHFNHG